YKVVQLELFNVLFEPLAKCILAFNRQNCRLVVDLGIAKPITIRTIYIAARREFDQNESEGGNFPSDRYRVFRPSTRRFLSGVDVCHRSLASLDLASQRPFRHRPFGLRCKPLALRLPARISGGTARQQSPTISIENIESIEHTGHSADCTSHNART